MRDLMQELLTMSQHEDYWPQDWMPWEMREVEHWSCEFAKYENGRGGERLKRRYNASAGK